MANEYFEHDTKLVPGTKARAEDVNARFDGVVAGMEKLPAPHPSLKGFADPVAVGSPTEKEHAVSVEQALGGGIGFGVDTGAANAYVVSLPIAPVSYRDGLSVTFKAVNGNTGPSTINLNGLGVKSLSRQDGTPLSNGDISANQICSFIYNGTNFKSTAAFSGQFTEFAAAVQIQVDAAEAHKDAAAASEAQTAIDETATNADAVATAADRVQTGLDVIQTAADLVATNQDTIDTAADVVQTGLDAATATAQASIATTKAGEAEASYQDTLAIFGDASDVQAAVDATAADAIATAADAVTTAADRVQTGLDAIATAADRVQTGLDVISAAASATEANTSKVIAEQAATDSQSVVSQDLTSSYETLVTSANVVDVFDYYVADDSDGGAWTKRCQSTSWYNEELNTATRGATREFPAHVKIVAETNKVTIFDATDPLMPMWMVFNTSSTNMVYGALIKSVSIKNGILSVTTSNGGVSVISFIKDSRIAYTTGTRYLYLGNISQRNSSLGAGTNLGSPGLINNVGNDVAMTVLPDAPIGPETGIAVPTIAVATDGGVSVIDGPAGVGTVVDSAMTGASGQVYFDTDGVLWYGRTDQTRLYSSDDYSSDIFLYQTYRENTVPATLLQVPVAMDINVSGGSSGLTLLKENTLLPSAGMVCYLTDSYISGWMQGDIRGAWLADTVAGDITSANTVLDRSVKATPLNVVGTITKTAVATGSDLVAYSGFSATNYLEQPYNSDLDFGTGDFYVMGWIKTGTSNYGRILERDTPGGGGPYIRLRVGGSNLYFEAGSQSVYIASAASSLFYVVGIRDSSGVHLYVNGIKVKSTLGTAVTVTNLTAKTFIGIDSTLVANWYGSISLLRMGAGAPSDEQILDIYNTEKELFRENATFKLPSANVQALDYDATTEQLLVGTDNGSIKLHGLVDTGAIVDTNLTSVDTVAVSLNRGSYTIGTASQAVGYTPAIKLKDELARDTQVYGFELLPHWFLGDSSETTFSLPSGWKPSFVYNAGLLVKDGASDEYTVTFDGYIYSVVFAVAPGTGKDIAVMATRRNG